MATHELKTWPEFYEAIISGAKNFDLRKNDRNFQVNDYLVLREWDPATKTYSGRKTTRRISYILESRPDAGCAADFGLNDGYAILAMLWASGD